MTENEQNEQNQQKAKLTKTSRKELEGHRDGKIKRDVLGFRPMLKPYDYPMFLGYRKLQESLRWTFEEVSMSQDVTDWNTLSRVELYVVQHIFNLFTQFDVEVGKYYLEALSQEFKLFEIRSMFVCFANVEVTHACAYDHLLDTLGIPTIAYSRFLEYEEMFNKYSFLQEFKTDTIFDLACSMVKFNAIAEGVQIYSMFAVLMSFMNRGLLKGVGQIVDWSNTDENLHAYAGIELIKILEQEKLTLHERNKLTQVIYDTMIEAVKLEKEANALIFAEGDLPQVNEDILYNYTCYLADLRIKQLGREPMFGVEANPLPWMNNITSLTRFANFFEVANTEYARDLTKGSFF